MASSKSRIVYESVVLTTINVVPGVTAERPNRVTFNGGIQRKAEYTTATFLLNVKQIDDVGNGIKREFEADTITVEEAQSIINGAGGQGSGIPFFCIHGFGVETGKSGNNMIHTRTGDSLRGLDRDAECQVYDEVA